MTGQTYDSISQTQYNNEDGVLAGGSLGEGTLQGVAFAQSAVSVCDCWWAAACRHHMLTPQFSHDDALQCYIVCLSVTNAQQRLEAYTVVNKAEGLTRCDAIQRRIIRLMCSSDPSHMSPM